MCIAAWIWQAHPDYRLLLVFNRDEYHDRPTKPLGWWEEGDERILGGRDELAGGTWLGCTEEGRLAFLTNVREPDRLAGARTRGDLLLRFLKGTKSPLEYAEEIVKEADQFNGFNLILADLCSKVMVYISNRPKGEPISVQTVPSGLHVLSNGRLDSPWPKEKGDEHLNRTVVTGRTEINARYGKKPEATSILMAQRLVKNFNELLRGHSKKEIYLKEMVEELMGDDVKANRDELPDTGCDPEMEFELSSIFIAGAKLGRYGTRSMAAVSVKTNGDSSFYEKHLEGSLWKENIVEFQIKKLQHM